MMEPQGKNAEAKHQNGGYGGEFELGRPAASQQEQSGEGKADEPTKLGAGPKKGGAAEKKRERDGG